MNSKQLYIRLLSYVRPYWKAFSLSVFLLAILAATEPLFPMLMEPLLNDGFTKKDDATIKMAPYFIVGIFLIRGILTFSSAYTTRWLSSNVVTDLRNQSYEHLINLPTRFFDNNRSGALASKIAYDVNNVTGAATTVLTTLVRDTLTIIALLAWLMWLDWELTLITLIISPPLAYTMQIFNKRMRYLSKETQTSMAELTNLIEQASTNHKVIKIFHGQDHEKNKFRHANSYQKGILIRSGIATFSLVPLTQIITSIAVAIIVGIAINGTNEATSTAGGFMSFLTAMLLLPPPIKRLAGLAPTLQQGLAAAESIFEIIDEKAEDDKGKENIDKIHGDISFSNVSFSYEDSITLENINTTIKEGSTTAIIGKSGSGKSTLISLLPRFYDISHGSITIGNKNIYDLSLNSLRNQISLVSQDIRLFNDSIAANVAYGEKKPNIERLHESLNRAHCNEFLEKMPDKENTNIGQDGVKLSGGQRQRIAIARAFYKNSPILILDEATSALDTDSEKQVQSALNDLMNGRTTIIIAHRLSTIEHANMIIVMDNGKIIDSGTHNKLLENNPIYKNHYNKQNF